MSTKTPTELFKDASDELTHVSLASLRPIKAALNEIYLLAGGRPNRETFAKIQQECCVALLKAKELGIKP